MIDTIIFDFGDIFINLDKNGTLTELKKLGLPQWNEKIDHLNLLFETGDISTDDFLAGLQAEIPRANLSDIKAAWNAVIADFPQYRLDFLQLLSQKYRLFLLSNTDSIHIEYFESKYGSSFYSDFYQCFEKVYFSFEIGLRKPNKEAYQYIINKHELSLKRTLFVDDKKENTDAAAELGLHVWNLQVGKEDVTELFTKILI